MFLIRVRPKILVFIISVFLFDIRGKLQNPILGNILILKSKKMFFFLLINKGLSLLLGSASKSNFWQYFNCVIKGNLIDFELGFFNIIIKGFSSLLGSALVP